MNYHIEEECSAHSSISGMPVAGFNYLLASLKQKMLAHRNEKSSESHLLFQKSCWFQVETVTECF